MGNRKDLGNFGKGKIVMARRSDRIQIGKTPGIVRFSQDKAVTANQRWGTFVI